ncbi:hypothetical protein [Hymenobacter rubripertinctus]|uniref:Uncharacterized protein n=1 Tax=Hymenobacter rubripertinctus TaxID=2029981 RepID=A0A418QX75_9BACT|nr:hypothetical protein [Hymenobacter rubripertinctus]RIY09763.1 hypothetical protein D0T11_11330 [Hymenobacter rubripertinctus]
MDRILEVWKPSGRKLAELVFYYDALPAGQVVVTGFEPATPPEGTPPDESLLVAVPLGLVAFAHEQLDSVAAVRAFDAGFIGQHLAPLLPEVLGPYQLTYSPRPANWRYVAATPTTVLGIIDVEFSFGKNAKHLRLTSGSSRRCDQHVAADVLTTNIQSIADLLRQQGHTVALADIRRVSF